MPHKKPTISNTERRKRQRESILRWRKANPEYELGWRAANPEKVRERARKWRAVHPERAREASRKYRATHLVKAREAVRKWYAANPDKVRAIKQRRRARKAGNGGSFTAEQWRALCAQYNNQCIGPGPHEGPLTADHVIPVGEPDSTSNIENIQPLCGPCNTRKGHRTIDYRYIELTHPIPP